MGIWHPGRHPGHRLGRLPGCRRVRRPLRTRPLHRRPHRGTRRPAIDQRRADQDQTRRLGRGGPGRRAWPATSPSGHPRTSSRAGVGPSSRRALTP